MFGGHMPSLDTQSPKEFAHEPHWSSREAAAYVSKVKLAYLCYSHGIRADNSNIVLLNTNQKEQKSVSDWAKQTCHRHSWHSKRGGLVKTSFLIHKNQEWKWTTPVPTHIDSGTCSWTYLSWIFGHVFHAMTLGQNLMLLLGTLPGDSIVALFSGKPLVGYMFCCPWGFFEGLRIFLWFQWIWALFGVQTHFTPLDLPNSFGEIMRNPRS